MWYWAGPRAEPFDRCKIVAQCESNLFPLL
jgi:hypothetical protein